MTRTILALLLSIGCSASAAAQHTWIRGFSLSDAPRFISSLPNDRLLIVTGNELLVVNAAGQVIVGRKSGTPIDTVTVSAAGDIYLIGVIDSPLVTKLDASLRLLWSKVLLPAPDPRLFMRAAVGTADGGLVMVGTRGPASVAVRLGADGSYVWARTYDASGSDVLASVAATTDGGFVAAGSNNAQPWMVKLHKSGAVAWQWTLGMRGSFAKVMATRGGDVVALGLAHADGASSPLLGKASAAGKRAWLRVGSVRANFASNLVETAAGDYAVVVNTNVEKSHTILGVTPSGEGRWAMTFRPPFAPAIDPAFAASKDGALLYSPSFGSARKGALVIKFDPKTAATPCPWLASGVVHWQALETADASRPLEGPPLVFGIDPVTVKLTDLVVRSEPVACVADPVAAVPGRPAPPPADTSSFTGLSQRDAEEAGYWKLLEQKEYAKLDAIAEQLRSRKGDPVYWDLERFYDVVASNRGATLDRVREWAKTRPQSATARVALVTALHAAAWGHRGEGYNYTVTDTGAAQYDKLMIEAQRALTDAAAIAAGDPHYQSMRVRLAFELGSGDVREIVRNAAKTTQYPALFRHAAGYMVDKWGGNAAKYRSFADEAARLTRASLGNDGMYAYLAYQARFNVKDWNAYSFDHDRIRRGCSDIVNAAPEWLPGHHRCALIASDFMINDRVMARELFGKSELDWYAGAEQIWKSRARYDGIRAWALGKPVEAFIETTPAPAPTPSTAPASQYEPPPPPPPTPVEASKLAKPSAENKLGGAGTGSGFAGRPTAQWPQIVMQNALTLNGATHREFSSFLVETSKGVVAVSALTRARSEGWRNVVNEARQRTESWTMASPLQPKLMLAVASFETADPTSHQLGVALGLTPFKGNLPVHPLRLSSIEPPSDRVFVVGCRWDGGRCTQTVKEGKRLGGDRGIGRKFGTIYIGFPERFDGMAFIGAAVLDEDGYAIAVVTGEASMTMEGANYFLAADELGGVVKP